MAMKMSELIKKTDTPKSTILYYIKEGLLPEPQKPKPNLHLYDESAVEMIGFIKYLQKHFGCSISEIKAVVQQEEFDFDKGFEVLYSTLDVIMGAAHQQTLTEEELCSRFDISPAKLHDYVERGLLFRRDGHFTQRESEILQILREGEANGIDPELLKSYVAHACELAKLEVELGLKLLQNAENRNRVLKSLFDTTLILKPYLFNMHTLKTYQSKKEPL
jgi:DNA-binding transcriptional MerR regulator